MIEKSKKQKRGGIITEKDASDLLNRYTANTVLSLLKEVAQFDGVKIDWDSLVKNTKTGISNVREYRMLWRHLAYRFPLPENINENDSMEIADDDSDLEFEVETFPDVSGEVAAEAAACVKVLAGFGLPSDSSRPTGTTVEAPMTINIPNGKATSETPQPFGNRGVNITVPVTVLRQPLPLSASAEGTDASGSTRRTNPPKRRRRTWTSEEEEALMASVQRCGEGNWDEISKRDFKGAIKKTQLSQRWATIKSKQGNLNLQAKSGGLQLSEAQRAARHAMNMALNPPSKNAIANSSDPITAAAIAAGARIAPHSSAASLLKSTTQSKNAVHIRPGAACPIKPFVPHGAAATNPVTHLNSTSMAATSISSCQVNLSNGSNPASVKPSPASTQQTSSEQRINGSTAQKEVRTAESIKPSASESTIYAAKEVAPNKLIADGVSVTANEPCKQIQETVVTLPKQKVEFKTHDVALEKSGISKMNGTKNVPIDGSGNHAEKSQNANGTVLTAKEDRNQPATMEIEHKRKDDKQAGLSGKELDDRNQKSEAVIKSGPGSEMMKG